MLINPQIEKNGVAIKTHNPRIKNREGNVHIKRTGRKFTAKTLRELLESFIFAIATDSPWNLVLSLDSKKQPHEKIIS